MTTDWNSYIVVPPLSIKNYSPDGWNAWYTQFKLRALVTPFPKIPEAEKVAVLLLKLGNEITFIFETFNCEVDKVGYEELVRRFTTYFNPIKSRNVFLNTKQKPGESFDQFAERLTVLSYPCCFGPFRESLLRDVYVCNMDLIFAKIRDKILMGNGDPSFQEVLRVSKELLYEECKVGSSRSVSVNNETPNAALSGASSRDGDSSIPCNQMKFKERDRVPNNKDPYNFKTPPTQTSLRTSGSPETNFSANGRDPHLSSLKLASALKNAIGNSSPRMIKTEVPKLDFTFKCFNEFETSRDGLSNAELLSRFSSVSVNSKIEEPTVIKSCSSEMPLNLSCSSANRNKMSNVSARLNKFGGKGALKKLSVSSETISDKDFNDSISSNILTKNQNDLSNNNDTEPCTDNSIAQSRCGPSDRNVDTWITNHDSHAIPVDYKIPSNKHETMSRIATPPGGGSFTNSKGNERETQAYAARAAAQNAEPNPKPDPPISKTCYSDVVIVYISENNDMIYVCPIVKYQYLGTIESELKNLYELNALKPINNITVGEKYAAPFKGDWYRAEIIAANIKRKTLRISFCDYGNEEDISLSDLRLLPEEFQELEPLSFPIRLPKGAPEIRSGSRLKIRPLSLEEDWSWAVELRTN